MLESHALTNGTTPATSRHDEHPAAVYLARLAPGSRRTMAHALTTIAGLATHDLADAMAFQWSQLRYQHTQALRAALTERYAPATANKMLAALRGVLREAWRLGQLPAEDYHRAVDLPAIRSQTLPRGRALPAGEIRALFEVCAEDTTPSGVRDAAMLALLYGAGLRRAELVTLDVSDYDAASSALVIRRGKGRKDRTAYVSNGAQRALDAWLEVRGNIGPLFVGTHRSGKLLDGRLTPQGVLRMVTKRTRQAGIKGCSPHDFRRSFVSDLIDQGADLVVVQQLAGHASVTTTARYDRRGEASKQRASEMVHVPYSPLVIDC